jgi:hypothetical protein
MAINKNHEFEELNGIKCAIVEKNASQERVDFLKPLLEFNNFTVVLQASPPPKVAAAPAAVPVTEAAVEAPPAPPPSVAPETFTIGVTDVMFNATNAIFGRLLKTKRGSTVTLAYWKQKEDYPHDQIPYYENENS